MTIFERATKIKKFEKLRAIPFAEKEKIAAEASQMKLNHMKGENATCLTDARVCGKVLQEWP